MKVVHVVPHIDQEASGPSYSVPRLCQGLAARGLEVEVSCLAAQGEIPGVRLELHPQWRIFGRFAISTSHAQALCDTAGRVDIIHNHSLWSMVNVSTGWVVPGKRAKLVTSPRGTLSPWALSRTRFLKGVLWPLQRPVLDRADLLHATSEVEYQEIRAQGFTAPVVIISNGVDLPVVPRDLLATVPRSLLFLSRIHPTKGIERLLRVWRRLQDAYPDWRLVVAGRGEPEHERHARKMAVGLGCERVEFPGPLYGEAKSRAYFGAELFVLPSHSENFGMVVAEALAHGCPAIVSRCAPWAGLETEDCGWWVANEVPQLTEALAAAMALPSEQLAEMGRRGRAWMQRDFGWESVAQRMESAYLWVLGAGPMPTCVRMD